MYKANIIINTLNGNQDHLGEAIESCLNQYKCNIELIISTIDGDPSLKFSKEKRIKFMINDKAGIYYQLNNATKLISHDYWCYLSGNDIMNNKKVFTEINLLNKYNKHICYSDYNVCDENMKFLYKKEFHDYSFLKNLEGNFIHDAALMTAFISKKYMPFNSEFDNLGYWDFWLRIGKDNPDAFLYNKHIAFNYRLSNDSRHVKRKNDVVWKNKEFEDRKKMLSRFGPLRGKYAKKYIK